MNANRGRQDQYQSGNDSGLLMGKQLYRTEGDGWERVCRPEELYPISFEPQDISLDSPTPPVTVQRFNRSASAMKNQAGRISTSGSMTLQFHVEDMAPWIREVLMSKDWHEETEDTETHSLNGVRNIRLGSISSDAFREISVSAAVADSVTAADGDALTLATPTVTAPWGENDAEYVYSSSVAHRTQTRMQRRSPKRR